MRVIVKDSDTIDNGSYEVLGVAEYEGERVYTIIVPIDGQATFEVICEGSVFFGGVERR